MPKPSQADQKLRNIAQDLQAGLKTLYGPRLRALCLYGSYARGDQREGSDLDILVILADMQDIGQELHRMSQLGSDLSLAHDLTISLLPITEWEFRNLRTPWLLNVRREGIPL